MSYPPAEVVCCGHVCVDVIPRMYGYDLPGPGELSVVGPVSLSSGGSVSNTGLALHRIGLAVRLVGRVGEDLFGRYLRDSFEVHAPGLSRGLVVSEAEATSYTIVLSPPGGDRRFLHCPGVNETFTDAHITDAQMQGAKHLHFGYPPIMQAMCRDNGQPLVRLCQRAHRLGLTTSLDMCGIDESTWAGEIDWQQFLAQVLSHIDLFMPSLDELAVMSPELAKRPSALLELGCRVAVVKDGCRSLQAYAADSADTLVPGWGGRTHIAPTYEVGVVGTTGAGDTTIAGYLAGLIRGVSFEHAADLACAAGAHCVQRPDAISGICPYDQLELFIATKPPRRQAT